MIRRAFLVAAAAVALILAPTTAMAAYNAPGYTCSVSDSTPASGVPFTASCSGGAAGEVVTLTTTRNPTLTKTADASGTVAFTVTITGAGTYSLVMTDASGEVLGSQSVTVVDAAVAVAGLGTGTGGQLSSTGFQGIGLVVGGGILVLVGAGAVLVARRRKSAP